MRRVLLASLGLIVAVMIVLPAEAAGFSIRFSWAGIPACKTISPAFTLTGVPKGTKRLSFVMTDLEVPTFHHGGSTIAYTGDAVARGAITYTGPCPPRGERHDYRWTVEALDAGGKVLATATATAMFPP
jgi:phosphatidylethanolamine-binding protein (PEBP) family uncharacterized protein